jgi:hypothetical protein
MTSVVFPEIENYRLHRWQPTEEQLKNSVIAVVGYRQTGKTTVINSFQSETVHIEESPQKFTWVPDGQINRIGSFQSFLDIEPTERGNIDFLIFCGLPSLRDINRVHERYQHLLNISAKDLYLITQKAISGYVCVVVDISASVRSGNKKAGIYWYRASDA